jgi:hypothetical protein
VDGPVVTEIQLHLGVCFSRKKHFFFALKLWFPNFLEDSSTTKQKFPSCFPHWLVGKSVFHSWPHLGVSPQRTGTYLDLSSQEAGVVLVGTSASVWNPQLPCHPPSVLSPLDLSRPCDMKIVVTVLEDGCERNSMVLTKALHGTQNMADAADCERLWSPDAQVPQSPGKPGCKGKGTLSPLKSPGTAAMKGLTQSGRCQLCPGWIWRDWMRFFLPHLGIQEAMLPPHGNTIQLLIPGKVPVPYPPPLLGNSWLTGA